MEPEATVWRMMWRRILLDPVSTLTGIDRENRQFHWSWSSVHSSNSVNDPHSNQDICGRWSSRPDTDTNWASIELGSARVVKVYWLSYNDSDVEYLFSMNADPDYGCPGEHGLKTTNIIWERAGLERMVRRTWMRYKNKTMNVYHIFFDLNILSCHGIISD